MRILYCGLKWNYGKKEEGYSYEWNNIEAGLRDVAQNGLCQALIYHPDEDDRLDAIDIIKLYKVDAVFHVAFNDTFDLPIEVANIALERNIPVIQFDCDSSWRFKDWILPRRNRVSHFVTTHNSTIPWYKSEGLKVIKSQWGCSPFYKPDFAAPKEYDVTFIGQKHGIRPQIVEALRASQINFRLFGQYWDGYPEWGGYLTSFDDMMKVFQRSKINLNLSNPWHIGTLPQIKGRLFEIPACGGFQLTTPADDTESYYINNKEIVIANSLSDLTEKIKYYLEHEKEREEIALAGYNRSMKDHTWNQRFHDIFQEIGLLNG